MPSINGIRWHLLTTKATRIRPVFTRGRGGNTVELPSDVGTQVFYARIQEKKLKSIGHVGEELHPEGLVNRKLYVMDFNYTVAPNSKVAPDVILGDRIMWITQQGITTYGRVVTLHDAADAGFYQTANIEWDGPLGDN